MICPICETENGENAVCDECGKQLVALPEPELELEELPGHQRTQAADDDIDSMFALAALDSAAIPQLEEIERTEIADPKAAVEVEPIELDSPLPEVRAPAPEGFWLIETPDIDRGRNEDHDPKTAAPDRDGPCPWCGLPGTGAVCNNCGRRRNRFTRDPEQPIASTADTMLCPACFARVPVDARCSECTAPLPRMELM